jgi:hypothetical protein
MPSSNLGSFFISPNTGYVGVGTNDPDAFLHVQQRSNETPFKVDGNEDTGLLFVDASGNVGIGTTTPSAKLHVQGTSTFSSDLLKLAATTADIGDPSTPFDNVFTDNLDTTTLTTTDGATIGGTLSVASNVTFSSNLQVSQGIAISSNVHSQTLKFFNDDYGIGTQNDIVYLRAPTFNVYAGGSHTEVSEGSTGDAGTDGSITFHLTTDGRIWTQGYGFLEEQFLTQSIDLNIAEDGNVGIGTTTPIDKLHVEGGITMDNTLNILGTTPAITFDESKYLRIGSASPSKTHFLVVGDAFTSSPGRMNFRYSNYVAFDVVDGVSSSEKIRMTNDGNVGIGVTNPQAKLDVTGTIKFNQQKYYQEVFNSNNNHEIVIQVTKPAFYVHVSLDIHFYGVASNSSGGHASFVTGLLGGVLGIFDKDVDLVEIESKSSSNEKRIYARYVANTSQSGTIKIQLRPVVAFQLMTINFVTIHVRWNNTNLVLSEAISTDLGSNTALQNHTLAGSTSHIFGGNVGIGVTNPQSRLQIGSNSDVVYANNNNLSNNTVTIFGRACANPTLDGTNDLHGTLFINSTDEFQLNRGASIALGGRGNDYGGGNQHMTFARITGTQRNDSEPYYGDLVFETQDSGKLFERLRIKHNGRFGIGTTNPVDRLHVEDGDAIIRQSSGNTRLRLMAGSSSDFTRIQFGHGTTTNFTIRAGNSTSGQPNRLDLFIGNNEAGDKTVFSAREDYFLLFKNVGIGSAAFTPTSRLHVNGETRLNVMSGVSTSGSVILGRSDNVDRNHHIEVRNQDTNPSGNWLRFVLHDGGNLGSRNEAMRITGGGSVGIGVTNPVAKLQISDNTGNALVLRDGSSYTFGNTADIDFVKQDTFTTARISGIDLRTSSSGTFRGGLSFYTLNGTVNGLPDRYRNNLDGSGGNGLFETMRITHDGNVGIGITNPSEKLHVNGTIKATINESGNDNQLLLTNGIATNGRVGIKFQTHSFRIKSAIIANRTTTDSGLNEVRICINNIESNDNVSINDTRMTIHGNGNVTITGNLTQNSDLRLKRNIQTIDKALEKVDSLRGVYFERVDVDTINNARRCIGFIAQELETVVPEVVFSVDDVDGSSDGVDSIRSVAYADMTALLLEAIKEMHHKHLKEVQKLNEQSQLLTQRIVQLEQQNDKLMDDNKILKDDVAMIKSYLVL